MNKIRDSDLFKKKICYNTVPKSEGVNRPWWPKTLVTEGKTLVTEGKALATEGKDLGDQREDLGDQREDLGDQMETLVIKGKTLVTMQTHKSQPAALSRSIILVLYLHK